MFSRHLMCFTVVQTLSLTMLSILAVAQTDEKATDIRASVVQITTSSRIPDPFHPWFNTPRFNTGSGTIISGNRILTNAHVVSFASQVYVQGFQSADKVAAKVLYSAPNLDLAILEVVDPSFFQGRPAVELSESLPRTGQTVSVYGFPIGGNDLSTTEGVVSRIEYAPLQNQTNILRIQVDAAVNPGNSGGPAIVDGKLIGVIFSKASKAENIGYLIAAEEVVAFLNDTKDGEVNGRPQWNQPIEFLQNESLRSYLKLDKSISGVMIGDLVPGVAAGEVIKQGDIVTHIEGISIDNDGRVPVSDSLRLPFHYQVPRLAEKGEITLTVVRDGISEEKEVPVTVLCNRLLRVATEEYPRYFIYGPLTFAEATSVVSDALAGPWMPALMTRKSPLMLRRFDPPAFEGEELVFVASSAFTTPLMKGYSEPTLATLAAINETKVKNLRHAAELIRHCETEYIRFEFEDMGVGSLVFLKAEIDASMEEILHDNNIRSDCSGDLRALWMR